MKQQYEVAKLEVIMFETEDVIVTSGGDPNEGELDP